MRGTVAKRLRKEVISKRKTYKQLKKEYMHHETKVWFKRTKRQIRLAITVLFVVLSISSFAQKQHKIDTTLLPKTKDTTVYLSLKMPVQNWNFLLNLIKTSDEKPSTIKSFTEFIMSNLKENK